MIPIVLAPLLMRMIWRHSLDICEAARIPDESYLNGYFDLVLHGLCAGEVQ
jgi:hypothetical protein